MQQQVTVLNIGKGREIKIPVNYQHFILDYSNSPEAHGYNREDVVYILECIKEGYPKDLRRAFDLYKECGLPYAHYRVGEFYEHGWGVRQDLEAAKAYYRQAYKEGHGLANKKLMECNVLK